MKRFWKIVGITFGSVVGFVLLIVGVVCYLVFTPERLTPIVNSLTDDYLTCPHTLDKVSLTYFSTFPYFGVEIDGLTIVNPVEGAPSDTVMDIEKMVVGVDLLKAIDGDIHIRQVDIQSAQANIYIDPEGRSNLDFLQLETDTTETDTTSGWQLRSLQIDKQIGAAFTHITYVDLKDSIDARLGNTTLSLVEGEGYHLWLDANQANCQIGVDTMLQNAHLVVDLPIEISDQTARIHEASIALNALQLQIDGTINRQKEWNELDYQVDLGIGTNKWSIDTVMALLPNSYRQLLPKELSIQGDMQLGVRAEGRWNDSVYPLLEVQLQLEQGKIAYEPVPYPLSDVKLDVIATADLSQLDSLQVDIRQLHAKTKQSEVDIEGQISQVFDDMWLQLQIHPTLTLSDIQYFLPDDMHTTGQLGGDIHLRSHLSELTALQLDKAHIAANVQIRDLCFQMDSLEAQIPQSTWSLQLPAPSAQRTGTGWGDLSINWDTLSLDIPGTLNAQAGRTSLHAQCSNLLSNNPSLTAWVKLDGQRQLHVAMDSLEATLNQPKLTASTCYNMQDTSVLPVVDLQLDCQRLQGYYTDIRALLAKTSLTAHLSGGKRNKAAPRLRADLQTSQLNAQIGEDTQLRSKATHIAASARYNPKQSNILLQWNPKLNVQLEEGWAELSSLALPVEIPVIDFAYSNKVFDITKSLVKLGNSDFELNGTIQNIGAWLRQKGELQGTLNFQSEYTDANELIALFSSNETAEDTTATTASADTTANPFMVPEHVNLSLNTHIHTARVFEEVLNDLRGQLYVRDGAVVLEEMGFTCKAAKLQLTAMYRTPRRNHIYVGLDYHMLDVDIAELIHIVPQMDTLVPMLSSFKGKAEFHLAAETYLNAKYQLKPSTIRGACSLYGKDLVVLDNETFSKISKLLMFNKKTENKVDSISAEITLYKNEIDVYPFCISIDNYMAALGGRHNLDMSFDYHISLLKPVYLGVDISGTFDNLDIHLANCRYAKDFRPVLHRPVDTRSAELRTMIRQSMQKNVKIQ